MNSSTIYDRKLLIDEKNKFYNNHSYSFPIDNNLLSNIITIWKNNTVNFTKFTCLKSQFDNNNNLVLKDNHTLY